jgi:hypothetical protein
MTEQEILKIWGNGNEQEIKKLRDSLNSGTGKYRVVHRSSSSLDRYFRTHKTEDGYSFNEKRYEIDGIIFVLEKIN